MPDPATAIIAIAFGLLFLMERHLHARTRAQLRQALLLEQQERARRQQAEAALVQRPPYLGLGLPGQAGRSPKDLLRGYGDP